MRTRMYAFCVRLYFKTNVYNRVCSESSCTLVGCNV